MKCIKDRAVTSDRCLNNIVNIDSNVMWGKNVGNVYTHLQRFSVTANRNNWHVYNIVFTDIQSYCDVQQTVLIMIFKKA